MTKKRKMISVSEQTHAVLSRLQVKEAKQKGRKVTFDELLNSLMK